MAFTIAPAAERGRPVGPGAAGRRAADDRFAASGPCKLAEFIHELNEQRQTLERSVYRAANKQAEELGDPQTCRRSCWPDAAGTRA